MRLTSLALLLLLCSTTCALAQGPPPSLLLAERGEARLPIAVHSARALPAELTAARELATYLEKITGAEFSIVEEHELTPGAPALYVGWTRFARSQGLDGARLGPEESLIRTVGERLVLTGGRPRGTLYAAYDLLENVLGVRWYTPFAEHVPTRSRLLLPPLNPRTEPYFRFRSHYTHLGPGEDWKLFNARNRINEATTSGPLDDSVGSGLSYGGRIFGGHGFAPYLPVEKYFEDHPEYYSLRDGQRVPSDGLDGNHACLTNPDVLRIIIEGVREDIAQWPDAYCYTVAVNDGGSSTMCDCDACREMARRFGGTDERYTDGGLMIWFVNQVAEALEDDHPDKLIRTLAYGPASRAPRNIRAHPNVLVQVCAGPRSEAVWLPLGNDSRELQDLREWAQYTDHLWVWDYALACYHYPLGLRPLTWKMDQQMKLFHQLGAVDGVFQENEILMSEDSMFAQFYEMNMWIFARLCQDPTQDVDELVADFLSGYYGPAGAPLREYVNLVKSRLPQWPYHTFDWEFMRRAQDLFDRAEAAVQGDPDLLDRVRVTRIPLDLSALAWRSSILRSYLAQGGRLEAYPWPIPLLRERVRHTLEHARHPYLLMDVSRYWLARRDETRRNREPMREIVSRYLDEISAGVEYTPLPAAFRDLPPERVIDLTAPLIAGQHFPLVVPDSEAALGLAVPRTDRHELPMFIGYWSPTPGGPAGGVEIKAEDLPGPGYHLYRGPTFTLAEWTYLYLTTSWRLQTHLFTLYDPQRPDQRWTAWASMKFSGPDYPHGTADEPSGLFLDRLILVRED